MEDRVYLNILYDYYGELLTDKQKEYVEDYYRENLTLQEIAENNNVSRNAIHKQIKEVGNKLYFYENILKIYKKNKGIEECIDKIKDKEIKEEIKRIIWE